MLLPQIVDTLVLGTSTSKENDTMYVLDHLYIKDNTIYSSNGHSLYYTSIEEEQDLINEYPEKPGIEFTPVTEPVLIPRKAIEKAINNRPKKNSLPILDNIVLTKGQHTELNLSYSLHTTDLEIFDTVTYKVPVHAEYPNVQRLLDFKKENEEKPEKIPVTLEVAELERLVKLAKKAKATHTQLTVTGSKDMVSIEVFKEEEANKLFSGLIMPCVTD